MQDHSITFYCKQCGKPFKSTSSKTARPNPQFCSNHCSAVDKANKKRRTDYPIHTCETCGKEFEHRRQGSLGRFCSQTCTMKSVNAKKNTSMWVTKTCPYCGEFFTHRQEKIDRIFCSPRCSTLHHRQSSARKLPRITVQCEMCGRLKDIRSKDLKKFRFCSAECRHTWVLQNMPRISNIERKMADAFAKEDMHPDTQYIVSSFSIDFAFVDQKLAVECDGDYWHNLPHRKIKDRQKDGCLRKHGWHVLRLWEHEINLSPIDCVKRVQARLQQLISSSAQL